MAVGTEVIQSGGTPPPNSIAVLGQEQAVFPTFGAGAWSAKPDEYVWAGRTGGHYSISGVTSAIATNAAAVMCAFRWTDTSSVAVIKRVRLGINVVTAVTAQPIDVDMIVARGYTARDATNATAVALTQDTGKTRSTMGSSALTNFDVASAAAGISGGTKTLDASPMVLLPAPPSVFTAGGGVIVPMWDSPQVGMHPLVLRANEGLLVRTPTAIATGTVKVFVAIDWLEAGGY